MKKGLDGQEKCGSVLEMINRQLYIIEARNEKGELLLGGYPQPESFFGNGAIKGMDDWAMSRFLFARFGNNISLSGDNIPNWPKLVDPNWVARKKTW
jgi:hypothetical protein